MKRNLLAVVVPLLVFFSFTSLALAQHGHLGAEKQPEMKMKMASTDVVADGLVVTSGAKKRSIGISYEMNT